MAKYSDKGQLLWKLQTPFDSHQVVTFVSAVRSGRNSKDNIITAAIKILDGGSTDTENLWIREFDSSGTLVQSKGFKLDVQWNDGDEIVVDPNGYILTLTCIENSTPFICSDYAIRKYDLDGALKWTKYTGDISESKSDISFFVDPKGNYVVISLSQINLPDPLSPQQNAGLIQIYDSNGNQTKSSKFKVPIRANEPNQFFYGARLDSSNNLFLARDHLPDQTLTVDSPSSNLTHYQLSKFKSE